MGLCCMETPCPPLFTAVASIRSPGVDTPASLQVWNHHDEEQLPFISGGSISVKHGAKDCSQRTPSHLTVTAHLQLSIPR